MSTSITPIRNEHTGRVHLILAEAGRLPTLRPVTTLCGVTLLEDQVAAIHGRPDKVCRTCTERS